MPESFYYEDDLAWDCGDELHYYSSYAMELTGNPHYFDGCGYESGCTGNYGFIGDLTDKCSGYAYASDLMDDCANESGTDEKLEYDELYDEWIISE